VHIEGVPAGGAVGPTGSCELFAADHRAIASDQRLHQAGLDRWQSDPAAVEPQHTVDIELGYLAHVFTNSSVECLDASADVGLVGGHAHPVLEAVADRRWGDALVDQQQPGPAFLLEPGPAFLFEGPPHEHHIHVGGR
jgi:hypothetical protein